jgi:hypothetical protein
MLVLVDRRSIVLATSIMFAIMELRIARPRFELGSKAPKASMLGHYSRQSIIISSTGLPGVFWYIFYYPYNVMLGFKNESILSIGSSMLLRIHLALLFCLLA